MKIVSFAMLALFNLEKWGLPLTEEVRPAKKKQGKNPLNETM